MDGEGMQLSNKVYRDGHWIWTVETKNWKQVRVSEGSR